jgi:hypothetical protein
MIAFIKWYDTFIVNTIYNQGQIKGRASRAAARSANL